MPRLAKSLRWIALFTVAALLGAERYTISRDGKLGFIDEQGREVIKPQFFPIPGSAVFVNGVAGVVTPVGAGYIDESGAFIIGPKKEWGFPRRFSEGYASVLIWSTNGEPNKPAIIDERGNVVLSESIREGAEFSSGLLPAVANGKQGFLDKTFHWAVPAEFDWVSGFCEGRAIISVRNRSGFIDTSGKVVVTPKYDHAMRFSDGLSLVRVRTATSRDQMTMEGPERVYEEHVGFIDRDGNEVIPLRFKAATSFSEGRAFAMPEGATKYAIIDKTGNVVHEAEFDEADGFHSGLAPVRIGEKWGYVDRSGKLVIPAQFTSAGQFGLSLAPVGWADGYGYIDRKGKTVWKTERAKP